MVILKELDDLMNKSFDYVVELSNKYDIDVGMTIYTTAYKDKNIDAILKVPGPKPKMWNAVGPKELDDESDKDGNNIKIIKSMRATIYMAYEEMLVLVIESKLDWEATLEYMKFLIKHEFGHIIWNCGKFIGMSLDDYNNTDIVGDSYVNLPKLRKNASFKKRLEWALYYNFNVPIEKVANETMGITREDVIKHIKSIYKK